MDSAAAKDKDTLLWDRNYQGIANKNFSDDDAGDEGKKVDCGSNSAIENFEVAIGESTETGNGMSPGIKDHDTLEGFGMITEELTVHVGSQRKRNWRGYI